jgi:uncharacterized damage-inducible protein DinB
MRQFTSILILCLAWSGGLFRAQAQQHAARDSAVRQAFLADLNDLENKLVSLAEAFPQDKLTWRPAPGIRSASEACMHVALSNYFFMTAVGAKPPSGIDQSAEKTVTEKAKVVDALKASIAFVRQGVTNLPEADLNKPTHLEGQQTSYEGALLIISGHMHEHLGQLIAYARMNGVVPPWSK